MRTTFTVDDDLVPVLKALSNRKKISLRQLLNELLRTALAGGGGRGAQKTKKFKVEAIDLGLRDGIDETKLNQIIDEFSVQDYLGNEARGHTRR